VDKNVGARGGVQREVISKGDTRNTGVTWSFGDDRLLRRQRMGL